MRRLTASRNCAMALRTARAWRRLVSTMAVERLTAGSPTCTTNMRPFGHVRAWKLGRFTDSLNDSLQFFRALFCQYVTRFTSKRHSTVCITFQNVSLRCAQTTTCPNGAEFHCRNVIARNNFSTGQQLQSRSCANL